MVPPFTLQASQIRLQPTIGTSGCIQRQGILFRTHNQVRVPLHVQSSNTLFALSPPIATILTTMLPSNTGLLPPSYMAYGIAMKILVPFAIPSLLFHADVFCVARDTVLVIYSPRSYRAQLKQLYQ